MFCNNTKELILKEMAQWQVEGEISGDEDIEPTGVFYLEAESEIKSALLQGGFSPCHLNHLTTPVAYNYIAALHRKLTALLYIQAHRLNILTDGTDTTRGLWGSIRRKLADISRGEPFGELRSPAGSAQTAYFMGDPVCGLNCHRSL